ncbi:MAG TPA: PAS domain S-box protein [Gemmatimonadota bacterium]|nr:PAS domain S-box protein [Gemmatimonadota bacterium]
MFESLNQFLASDGFMPHGACYLWKPELVWLHVIADSIIALSYFAIPLGLVYLLHRRRREIPFHWMFGLFAIFFVACGMTHVMGVWTVWNPDHWLSGGVKVVTAIASLGTVVLLVPLLPRAIALKSSSELEQVNRELASRETQLAEAQKLAGLGSWEWDVGEDSVTWSREMYRIYGLEPGTPVSYPTFLERIHPGDRAMVDETVRDAVEKRQDFSFRERIVRPDGETRVLQSQGRFDVLESGDRVRLLGICQDITGTVRAEETLRQREEDYRRLAENVREMIVRFTPEGQVTYASPATRALLGYDPAEVMGRDGSEFLHEEDLERVVEAHRDLLHGVEPPPVVCRLLHRDGNPVWVETTTRGVQSPEDGRLEAIVAVSRDVTESVHVARSARLLQQVAMVANESDSERDALQTALRLVCELTGWPVGHVYVPSPDTRGELKPTDLWHLDDPERHESFRRATRSAVLSGQELPGRVLQSGRAEWVRDIQADPTFIRTGLAKELNVRAALAFPVRTAEETIAVIEFFSDRPEEPDDRLVNLMDSVGSQLGEVLRRRWTEQALRASEEQYRALAESASDAIVTIDERGRVVYCNESVDRIFGYSCGEMKGKEAALLLPDRHRDAYRAGLARFLETGESPMVGRSVELIGRRRDGSEFPVELSLSRWQTDRGSFVTGILRDITARKWVEKTLEEKVEELARSNAELGLFTYIASHDLREPLRTVGSNLQLLERHLADHIDGDARKQIDFAQGGVRRMQALIDDLLLYSRVGTEGRAIEDLDSGEVVEDAVQALTVAIEESAGQVTASGLPTIRADRSQLVQLFQNLVSNAIKFRAAAPPRIDVSAEREGDAWIFSVRDNGIGIEGRYAEHVFTIFQRLHTPEKYPGTGIGLAVCRKIVERHGGHIWVESAPGGGSRFRFTIPIRA